LAKHLDKSDIQAIVSMIYGWANEKLTWDALCDALVPLVGKRPTRQSLSSHEAISNAFKSKKTGLKVSAPKETLPSSLKIAAARIARLKSENEDLREQVRTLKQQFVVWQYNAYKRGLKEHDLNEPLPKIDRERNDREKR